MDDEDVQAVEPDALAPAVGERRGFVVGGVYPVGERSAEHGELGEVGFGVPSLRRRVDEDGHATALSGAAPFGFPFCGAHRTACGRLARRPVEVARPQVSVEESGVRVDERGLGSVERAFAQAIGQPMEDAGAVLVD